MSDMPPLTADDFEVKYDADHTYPFYEDEEGDVYGYGHPDKVGAAAWVKAYYDYIDPAGDKDDHHVDPADVRHLWAVRLPDDGDGFRFHFVRLDGSGRLIGADEPGAFPIWMVTR